MSSAISGKLPTQIQGARSQSANLSAWQQKTAQANEASRAAVPMKTLKTRRQESLNAIFRGQGNHFDCDDTTGWTEHFVVQVNINALSKINAHERAANPHIKEFKADPKIFVGASDAIKVDYYKKQTGSTTTDAVILRELENIKLEVIREMAVIETLPGVREHTNLLHRMGNRGNVVSNGSQAMTTEKLARMVRQGDGRLDESQSLSLGIRKVFGAHQDKKLHKPHHFPFENSTVDKIIYDLATKKSLASTHFYYEDSTKGRQSADGAIARLRNGATAAMLQANNIKVPPNLGGMTYGVVATPNLAKELELKFDIKTTTNEILQKFATPQNIQELKSKLAPELGRPVRSHEVVGMLKAAIEAPEDKGAAATVNKTVRKWVAKKAIETWEKSTSSRLAADGTQVPNYNTAKCVIYRDRREVIPFNRLALDRLEWWKKDFLAKPSRSAV